MAKHLFPGWFLRRGLGTALALSAVACGPQFDPPSKLQSLRVLAVQKDDPFLRPNATTPASDSTDSSDSTAYEPDNVAHMVLAMQDSRLKADQQQTDTNPIQKLWFAGCNNPPRDDYFSCLLSVWLSFKAYKEFHPKALKDGESWSIGDPGNSLDFGQIQAFLQEVFPGFGQGADPTKVQGPGGESIDQQVLLEQALALRVGAGDRFDYTVPSWVIERHSPSADEDIPRYGLSQVFVAVCDGDIDLSPAWETNVDPLATLTDATRGFPLTCYQRGTKVERGPDNFMVSYSNLYVYDQLKNKNPVIDGFSIDGNPVSAGVCVGEACLEPEPSCKDDTTLMRVKRCHPSGANGCQELVISPILVEGKHRERDDIASTVGGGDANLLEQMWIRYYADQGDIARDTKRLQDASDGWFAEHDTKWSPPKQATDESSAADDSLPAHLWAVVYDNRGGVAWARVSVCLED